MKELRIAAGPRATMIDSSIPRPGPDQLVIRVIVAGANPKDWKYPERFGTDANQGEDMAGVVHEVGDNVTEFKAGDRVAAFHEFGAPHGAYAEYAVAWAYTTFHIPKTTTFEGKQIASIPHVIKRRTSNTFTEAATIPLSAMTAALALFSRLALPTPLCPATHPVPLIINGASSAVGSYAVKLCQRANIHPLILLAGKSSSYVSTLLQREKGDVLLDYREGQEEIVSGIRRALEQNGLEREGVRYAFDVISERGSWRPLVSALDPKGAITTLRPIPSSELPDSMTRSRTGVAGVHRQLDSRAGDEDFGFVFFRLFGKGLQEGWLTGQPWELRPGGLDGVEAALRDLKEGRNRAKKYLFRVQETKGAVAAEM